MQRVRLRAAPHTWMAFSMTAVEGIPAPEVARRLGMKIARVYAARSTIQQRLQEECRRLESAQEAGDARRRPSRHGVISWNGNEAMPDCPPRAILERFLAGVLDDREEEDLCAHVEGCSACQGELDDLVAGRHRTPRPARGRPSRAELDLSFLERLQQTLTDPDWRPPPWTESGRHLDRTAGLDGPPPRVAPGPVPGYESSASWAGAPWGSCTRRGSSASGG